MGGCNQVGRVSQWFLQAISGIAFMRFILKEERVDIDSGFILIADDDRMAKQIAKRLCDNMDAVNVSRWSSRTAVPYNYQLGIHVYRTTDNKADLCDFLMQEDFLPAVIVGGIVPECLQGQGYIFRIACDCKDIEAFAPKYESFKEFIIQHPDLDLQQDLLNCFSNDFGVDTQQLPLLNSLSAVGMAWQRYYSYQEYALQDGQDFKAYIRYWQGLLRNMNRLEADYDVSDIVGKLILFYIMSNAYVPISDANGELSIEEVQALQREAGILYNDRFYFIPESLLKKMCQPILV